MKLQTLTEVNVERAARRPVIVITDTANGEQRLVKAADIAADPLRADLAKQLRMGKSGMIEAGGKTTIEVTYKVGGYVPGGGVGALAAPVDGVLTVQVKRLAQFVSTH